MPSAGPLRSQPPYQAVPRYAIGERADGGYSTGQPAFLFDLDGTLIDSVYEHTLAWREALEEMGISLATVAIHRRIGMTGGMLVHAFEREAGKNLTPKEIEHVRTLHSYAYKKRARQVRPLPGAHDLLQELSNLGVPWAIATSGKKKDAKAPLTMLRLDPHIPVVTRDDVKHAKPEPDLFLAAAAKLKFGLERCVVASVRFGHDSGVDSVSGLPACPLTEKTTILERLFFQLEIPFVLSARRFVGSLRQTLPEKPFHLVPPMLSVNGF